MLLASRKFAACLFVGERWVCWALVRTEPHSQLHSEVVTRVTEFRCFSIGLVLLLRIVISTNSEKCTFLPTMTAVTRCGGLVVGEVSLSSWLQSPPSLLCSAQASSVWSVWSLPSVLSTWEYSCSQQLHEGTVPLWWF